MSRFDSGLLQRALAFIKPQVVPEPQAPVDLVALALPVALALMRRFEGFRSHPYLCPAGVPTIGYGQTHYLDGRPVTLRDKAISRETAERLLLGAVRKVYLPAVLQLCPTLDTPERLAAIIDWCFNLGSGALRSSTMRRKILARDWGAARVECRKWNKAAGRVLRGLVIRREAEAGLL